MNNSHFQSTALCGSLFLIMAAGPYLKLHFIIVKINWGLVRLIT